MAKKKRILYIIDGYNVLRSGSRYKTIKTPDHLNEPYNASRDKLINDVNAYFGGDSDSIIVFDAAEGSHVGITTTDFGNTKVVFSPIGQSADRIIEKLAHDARESSREAIVVTSDATIQDTVFGGCVTRMSAEGFCRALSVSLNAPEEKEETSIYSKNTVQDRVSPDVREKLRRLRDSL